MGKKRLPGRDEKGRFIKGSSGGPGRGHTSEPAFTHTIERLKASYDDHQVVRGLAVAQLEKIVRSTDKQLKCSPLDGAKVRLAASKALLASKPIEKPTKRVLSPIMFKLLTNLAEDLSYDGVEEMMADEDNILSREGDNSE